MKLILLLLVSCSSYNITSKRYLVRTSSGVFICNEFNHGTYGAAAKDCKESTSGRRLDLIPNPYIISEIQ